MSVRTQPGCRATHRARPARASDRSLTTELSAALEARYSQPEGLLRRPMDPMREDSRPTRAWGASASSSWGSTCMAPSTLVCITRSKSASVGGCRPAVDGP